MTLLDTHPERFGWKFWQVRTGTGPGWFDKLLGEPAAPTDAYTHHYNRAPWI